MKYIIFNLLNRLNRRSLKIINQVKIVSYLSSFRVKFVSNIKYTQFLGTILLLKINRSKC